MKTEEYTRTDGTKGTKNIPEPNDKVTSRYEAVRTLKGGKYENYSLGVKLENGEDTYIKLTKGQKTQLEKIGNLQNKKLEFYSYTNEYGNQIGVKEI